MDSENRLADAERAWADAQRVYLEAHGWTKLTGGMWAYPDTDPNANSVYWRTVEAVAHQRYTRGK